MTPLAAYCSAAVTSPLGLPSRSKRPPPAPYLSVHGLTMAFGGVGALDGVTFAIERGELVGLIGPNGSGKTTLVNILSGHLRPDDGHVELEDRRIDGPAARDSGATGRAAHVSAHPRIPTHERNR